jgi:hypothetical protein
MKEKYTEEIHVKRLLELFETSVKTHDVCHRCPADLGFPWHTTIIDNWDCSDIASYPCTICTSFVGKGEFAKSHCPCQLLDDPVNETWLALEAKGYI